MRPPLSFSAAVRKRGLHDAAGRTEDITGSGGRSERIVEVLVGDRPEIGVRQRPVVDAEGLGHPDEFAGREDGVRVRQAVGV